MIKTNAVRKLAALRVAHEVHDYADTGAVSGTEVAEALGEETARVFKTLVTVGKSSANYVFVIPVQCELDLKKAADAVGEKSVEMIKSKQLLLLTGYVHGGCSPIGMKKQFRTLLHESAADCATIYVSGGRIGCQIELAPEDLRRAIDYELADLVK